MLGVQNKRRIWGAGGAKAALSVRQRFFWAFFGMSTSAKINLVIAEK